MPAPDACKACPRPAWLSQTSLVWSRWEFYGPATEGQARNSGSEKQAAHHIHAPRPSLPKNTPAQWPV